MEMAEENHSKQCLRPPTKFDHSSYGQNFDATVKIRNEVNLLVWLVHEF